jgi:hypothetical protein
MQSLITLLLQLSTKAWTTLVVAVLCGGAVTAFYFSSANAGPDSGPANAPGLTVAIQRGQVPDPGHGLGHQTAPLPVVPEANAGLALIPVVAAMLFFSARRLWLAQRSPAADGQSAKGISES